MFFVILLFMKYSERLPGLAEDVKADPFDSDQPAATHFTGKHVRDYMPEGDASLYLDTIVDRMDAILVQNGIEPPKFDT